MNLFQDQVVQVGDVIRVIIDDGNYDGGGVMVLNIYIYNICLYDIYVKWKCIMVINRERLLIMYFFKNRNMKVIFLKVRWIVV